MGDMPASPKQANCAIDNIAEPIHHGFLMVNFLDQIKKFEGYTDRAKWDYQQFTNGYGTKARFLGESINKEEAEIRFRDEISVAYDFVNRVAPQADAGTKAALTSLTFNAGTKWASSGLGAALRRGDIDGVRELFVQYDKAGGQRLEGLTRRRHVEASWIGQPGAVGILGNTSRDWAVVTTAAASPELAATPTKTLHPSLPEEREVSLHSTRIALAPVLLALSLHQDREDRNSA